MAACGFKYFVGAIIVMCAVMTVLVYSYKKQVVVAFQQTMQAKPTKSKSIEAYLNADFIETIDKNSSSAGQCSHHFDQKRVDILAKIERLNFSGVQQYTKSLFPPLTREPVPTELPVFVTGFSSNHYAEGSFMLKHVNDVVRVNYKDLNIIMYDLGLTEEQVKKVGALCSCKVRKFPFHLYPKHVEILNNFAWKPIIIQTVAKEHPLLFWLDASVRFKTGNLDGLIADVKKKGLMIHNTALNPVGELRIPQYTLKETFAFLKEPPCAYENVTTIQGGFIVLFANQLITKYFIYPLVACALSFGCMEPFQNSQRYLPCPQKVPQHTYHKCHRYDQSVIGILHSLLFHREWEKHAIDLKYFMFCRFPGIKADC